MKYRKIPVIIEAVDWFNTEQSEYPDWLTSAIKQGTVWFSMLGTIKMFTLEGVMQGNAGDYIIRGVNGEIYPCKPDIFAKTYEPVEDCNEK